MPCYQQIVIENKINTKNLGILLDALNRLNIQYKVSQNNNTIIIFGDDSIEIDLKTGVTKSEIFTYVYEYERLAKEESINKRLNLIKREVSKIIVHKAATKNRWSIKWNQTQTAALVNRK